MNDFLPQGYETPETPSHYMELEEGPNAFRILSYGQKTHAASRA
jgi:hypothetical protein